MAAVQNGHEGKAKAGSRGEAAQAGKSSAQQDNIVFKIRRSPIFLPMLVIILLLCIAGTALFIQISSKTVYIENSLVSAPIISLSPDKPGVLEKVYVKEGDLIGRSKILAMIGGNPLLAREGGIVVGVMDNPGQLVSPQDAVVQMIRLQSLKVVGRVEEDKGLRYIKPGQDVMFTVDAFAGRKFYGIVDMVSPSSRQSDIVFSISDKRQENEFNVNVRYDTAAYPELRNGMSAKMWVYK